MANNRHNRDRSSGRISAFTLVEVLVVLFLLLILASIALPTAKEMIADQLVARTARGLAGYVDVARNRAISESRQVGVLIERAGIDARGRAHSIRLRQLTSVPPYTGDASNAVAVLQTNGTTANFDPSNNQLLALSASMVASSPTGTDDPRAPIRNGDYIEFPGGRIVPFTITYRDLSAASTVPVEITFDLNEGRNSSHPQYDAQRPRELFPSAGKTIPSPRDVKYKIHRRPVVSTVAPFNLPRGVVIDLNYSGFGVSGFELKRGREFAPDEYPAPPATPTAVSDIAIVFGPDGKVVSVTDPDTGSLVPPDGQMFLCMGDADGVRPDNLFSQENKATANLLNLDSIWIVLNPSTGRIVTSPFAAVSTLPSTVITDPTDTSLGPAISEARLLANFTDTVDLE